MSAVANERSALLVDPTSSKSGNELSRFMSSPYVVLNRVVSFVLTFFINVGVDYGLQPDGVVPPFESHKGSDAQPMIIDFLLPFLITSFLTCSVSTLAIYGDIKKGKIFPVNADMRGAGWWNFFSIFPFHKWLLVRAVANAVISTILAYTVIFVPLTLVHGTHGNWVMFRTDYVWFKAAGCAIANFFSYPPTMIHAVDRRLHPGYDLALLDDEDAVSSSSV